VFEVDIQQDLIFGTAEASVERDSRVGILDISIVPRSPTKQVESTDFY
jgi:hypothetical protein